MNAVFSLCLAALLTLGLDGPSVGGWRVNGKLVFHTTQEFSDYLKTASFGSIKLLELSGHATRLYQSMNDFPDTHVESALVWKDSKWLLVDKDDRQPDPDWEENLRWALGRNALVYFYGCQTGMYDSSGLVDRALSDGIARAFSQDFQVTTFGSPEFVYYPDEFPAFDEHFRSNPTEPPTENQDTPGGIWNEFRCGRWIEPKNPAEVTSLKVLRPPVVPPGEGGLGS